MKAILQLVVLASVLMFTASDPALSEATGSGNVAGVGNLYTRHGLARGFRTDPCTPVGPYDSQEHISRPFFIYMIMTRVDTRDIEFNWEVRLTNPVSHVDIERGTDHLVTGQTVWCYHRELNNLVAAPGKYLIEFLVNGKIIGWVNHTRR